MKAKKRITLFSKILIVLFTGSGLAMITGRDHFMLGTGLILFRWVFLVLGLWFLYLSLKRTAPRMLRVSLAAVLFMVLLEYAWSKVNEGGLKDGLHNAEVSLMTYNLFFRNWDPKTSVKKISEYDPDILVVQEVTPAWKAHLGNSIARKYSYSSVTALKGTHGIAVYSKFRILDTQLLKNRYGLPFAQIVEIEIRGKKVQLINVHLASPAIAVENPDNFIGLYSANYKLREEQLEKIHSVAAGSEDKVDVQVLIGDLNTTRYEPVFRDLKSDWVDLFSVAGKGWGFNFPNSEKVSPFLTLDYILIRGAVKGMEIRVVEGGSSDHLALVGRIGV